MMALIAFLVLLTGWFLLREIVAWFNDLEREWGPFLFCATALLCCLLFG